MSITLVRHTQPDVETGVCYGLTDLALADSFDAEARKLIADLPKAQYLITSPLLRCRSLAARIGAAFDIHPVVDFRLREMDFGTWEGCAWKDVSRQELDEWSQNFLHARPHGGESVSMLRDRVSKALADYRQAGNDHIIVTHAGVIKVALAGGDTMDNFNTSVAFGQRVELK